MLQITAAYNMQLKVFSSATKHYPRVDIYRKSRLKGMGFVNNGLLRCEVQGTHAISVPDSFFPILFSMRLV